MTTMEPGRSTTRSSDRIDPDTRPDRANRAGAAIAASSALDTALRPRSPIILTGRGGSGTRMLSEMAERCGIFLGNELNRTRDSVEWADLLYDMTIREGEGSPIADARERATRWEEDLLDRAATVLETGDVHPARPWGWKLPESMLVVPELMAVFTHAKLVHLVRHPVTSSLRRTHKTSRPGNPVGRAVLERAYREAGFDPDLIRRHEDYLRNAITWRYQVGQVSDYARRHLPASRYLEIRYEDLCRDPEGTARRLIDFVGGTSAVPAPPRVDESRTGRAESHDPRASEVWEICRATATGIGYDAEVPR